VDMKGFEDVLIYRMSMQGCMKEKYEGTDESVGGGPNISR
jgi:hypothetical protein